MPILDPAEDPRLESEDYVLDPVFGVVAKDVPTRLRLEQEARAAEVAAELAEEPKAAPTAPVRTVPKPVSPVDPAV